MTWEKALGRVPSGVFVVSMEEGGERFALLASWVQQASFDPPRLTVAIHRDRPLYGRLKNGTTLIVHILSESDKDAFKHFAKGVEPGQDPFEGFELGRSESGQSILRDCLAYLECKVQSKLEVGDHDVFLLDICGGELRSEDSPRIHIRKNGLSY